MCKDTSKCLNMYKSTPETLLNALPWYNLCIWYTIYRIFLPISSKFGVFMWITAKPEMEEGGGRVGRASRGKVYICVCVCDHY